ncbi:MAG: hypothetical protein H0V74_06700 [Chloroflexi bacterium]|nr:hypothetical protein [Chloroflexota bacterium]
MSGFLLRLYPVRWRRRYGDEFRALLEERSLGPFDVADVFLAAIDAHLHMRGRDAAPDSQRSLTMSLRLGGAAAILGGVLLMAGFVVTAVDGSDDAFPGSVLILAAMAALLLALVGLSAFQARRHPRLIWAAFAVPAFGTAVSCVGLVTMATVGDRPLVAGLSPWAISMIGLSATVLGSALFALATYHTHVLSRPAAGSLAAGSSLLFAVLLLALSGIGRAAGAGGAALPQLLMVGGLFAFSIGWIALGWAAVRLDRPATAAI